MKTKELKEKKVDELLKLLSSKREELRALRSSVSGSKSRNVKEISTLRKDVARILTQYNASKTK